MKKKLITVAVPWLSTTRQSTSFEIPEGGEVVNAMPMVNGYVNVIVMVNA